MFQYQNGRLSSKGISFLLPNNCYLNTDPGAAGDNLIELWSQNKDYMIIIAIEEDCLGTKKELEQAVSDDSGDCAMDEIKEISLNGLTGHFLFYKSITGEKYQIRLDLKNNNLEFVIYIDTKSIDICKILSSKEVCALLQSIEII